MNARHTGNASLGVDQDCFRGPSLAIGCAGWVQALLQHADTVSVTVHPPSTGQLTGGAPMLLLPCSCESK